MSTEQIIEIIKAAVSLGACKITIETSSERGEKISIEYPQQEKVSLYNDTISARLEELQLSQDIYELNKVIAGVSSEEPKEKEFEGVRSAEQKDFDDLAQVSPVIAAMAKIWKTF